MRAGGEEGEGKREWTMKGSDYDITTRQRAFK